MANLTNITKSSKTLTGVSRTIGDALPFYGWLFWFTIPQFSRRLTNTTKNTASLTNVARS